MPFRPEDLHDLDIAQEVRIETRTGHDDVRSTVIWIVVDNGQVFVRSVRGADGRWYQEALADPNVTVDDKGRRLLVKAVPVHDPDSNRRVSEALKRKYADDKPGLASMIKPDVLDTTLRLEPRYEDEIALQAPAYLDAESSELGPPVEIGPLDGGGPIDESVILQPHKPV